MTIDQTRAEFRQSAIENGFSLSHATEEKIVDALKDHDINHPQEKGDPLSVRFRRRLRANPDALPSLRADGFISADMVKGLIAEGAKEAKEFKAAGSKRISPINQILEIVTEQLAPNWREAEAKAAEDIARWANDDLTRDLADTTFFSNKKAADAARLEEEKTTISRSEAIAKQSPQTLITHGLVHGLTITEREFSAMLENYPAHDKLITSRLEAVGVEGLTTGKHGNRTGLPNGAISLSAAQVNELNGTHPNLVEEMATAIARTHGYSEQLRPQKSASDYRRVPYGEQKSAGGRGA